MPRTPRWKRPSWRWRRCKRPSTASRLKKSLLCPRGSSMWLPRGLPMGSRFARLAAVMLLSASVAGCFQPLYGNQGLTSSPNAQTALAGVDVQQIVAGTGSPDARIAVEVRNDLLFGLNGGGAPPSVPTHELRIRLTTTRLSVIVDVATARPDMENFGLNATY